MGDRRGQPAVHTQQPADTLLHTHCTIQCTSGSDIGDFTYYPAMVVAIMRSVPLCDTEWCRGEQQQKGSVTNRAQVRDVDHGQGVGAVTPLQRWQLDGGLLTQPCVLYFLLMTSGRTAWAGKHIQGEGWGVRVGNHQATHGGLPSDITRDQPQQLHTPKPPTHTNIAQDIEQHGSH